MLLPLTVLFATAALVCGLPHLKYQDAQCGYQACPATDPSKLNVHLIPHSHDDLGWLQTVDKYYYKQVQYVISTVVEALEMNPNRRQVFIQVETAFFHYWWQFQDEDTRNLVKKLINEGRLEVINGGWSMNDEATTHYQSTIDQFTFGHLWLQETFGECGLTKTGWQIDPFGHSREQASIYAQMGFDSFFIMRFDYRDKGKRKNEKTLDLLWRGSDNLASDTNIFTSGFSEDTYAWPNNLCFDMSCDKHVVTDERSTEFNLRQIINDFMGIINERSQHYPTNNLFITMGDDVHYQGAHKGFISIDRIIDGFKQYNPTLDDGRELNVFYSTPSCYTKAVHDSVVRENITLSYKTDDFLPLVTTDFSGCWTGFFTSRPTSKRLERVSNNVLQATKQLVALAGFPREETYHLEDAVGIMQHHDAMPGTELQDVEKDYHRRMHAGIMDSVKIISRALTSLLGLESDIDLHYCPFANISICAETKKDKFRVLLYNPLGVAVDHYVQLPIDAASWTVTDPEGVTVKNSIYSPVRNFQYMADDLGRPFSDSVIMFKADNLPPLGYKVYTVEKTAAKAEHADPTPTEYSVGDELRAGFQNNYIVLDTDTGLVDRMAINGFEMKVTPRIMFYYSDWSSGAYMFKPNGSHRDPVDFGDRVESKIKSSPVSVEIKQEWRDWGIITFRIYPDTDYIEVDWVAGPIDVGDGQGRDVIIRYDTDLETNGFFYTDSNSRELMERKRNFRPTFEFTDGEPQAGNYYPVTSRIVMKDVDKGVEFAIITDRAEGGSSLSDGQLELMVHRALLRDEFSNEHLYEMEYGTGLVARGSHYITFGPTKSEDSRSAAFIQRDIAVKKHQTPLILFPLGDVPDGPVSFLREELPVNVRLLTLQKWKDEENKYLLRLEHFLEKNDDEELSKEVTVDVQGLFPKLNIVSLEERTLNGVTRLEEAERLQWPQTRASNFGKRVERDPADLKITLAPMQIRTFIATVG
ncbi:hypothetical protein NQ315_006231 [Exocentrus adspersus]|uniref:Alpha-mannosidase n=1 Tax=Exocentrus adspersus TaxID=1586481 RepID=A0AAV8VZH0_9CUCU|nr:hypothetical protein NQ315_006231 [Exocentrus adspersus]